MLRKWLKNKVFTTLGLFLFLTALSAQADEQKYGYKKKTRIWFCSEIVQLDNKNILYISNAYEDDFPNHYENREEEFQEYIEELTNKKGKPVFSASCRDYMFPDKAKKHRNLEIKNAKRLEFKIIEFSWEWSGNVRREQKSNTK